MKQTALSILVGAQLFAQGAGGELARASDAQVPPPAAGSAGVGQAYRLPPPMSGEPQQLPPTIGVAIPETNCPPGAPPPASSPGPMGRWWHYHAKPALQESHWGYREQFNIRPFGTYMRAAVVAQAQNGIADQLVLYHSDFVTPDGQPGVELNAKGRLHLGKISELIPMTMCPLVIQVDEQYVMLNAARRAHVAAALQLTFGEFPEERIMVGRARARGLTAQEAVLIQQNVLRQIQQGSGSSFGGAIASGTPAGVGSSAASVPGPSVLPGRSGY